MFGSADGTAPLYVHNEVDFYDCRLDAGTTVTLPTQADRDTYLYVFDGAVTVGREGSDVGFTESALVTGSSGSDVPVIATEDSTIIAFSIGPERSRTSNRHRGRAYAGQTDKSDDPYIRHPLRIMEKMDTDDERVVAVLHDVVEDSEYTLHDIESEFGDTVRDAVDAVTR